MQNILMLAMLLLTPPDRAHSPFPATIMTANRDVYLMWGPDKVNCYRDGVKRRAYDEGAKHDTRKEITK